MQAGNIMSDKPKKILELDFISLYVHIYQLIFILACAFVFLIFFINFLTDGLIAFRFFRTALPLLVLFAIPIGFSRYVYKTSFLIDPERRKLIYKRKLFLWSHEVFVSDFDDIKCLRIEGTKAQKGVTHYTLSAVIDKQTRHVIVRRLFASPEDLRPLMYDASRIIGCDYESDTYNLSFTEHVYFLFKDISWI